MNKDQVVSHISLADAVKLLGSAEKEGIGHVVSLIRDPKNPSRILGMSVMEAEPTP